MVAEPVAVLLTDFDYHLPPELIAQQPAEPRDTARLMVLDKASSETSHTVFSALPSLLEAGDAVVLNDTRVSDARLRATRSPSGGRVEILLTRHRGGRMWSAMAKPARRLKAGDILELDTGPVLRVRGRLLDGELELEVPPEVTSDLSAHGELPLPPYITAYTGTPERYQTVYARDEGSVAAPTAGLHVTPQLLSALAARGIAVHYLTLHVGPGTFKPVTSERPEEHVMHPEACFVPDYLPSELQRVRGNGGRVVAVGTTVTRALEAAALQPETAGKWSETDIFILPGHRFRLVDALVTNFHLPKSTLIMLVSALAGRERVLEAYREAVERGYRFYSFGDAMLVV